MRTSYKLSGRLVHSLCHTSLAGRVQEIRILSSIVSIAQLWVSRRPLMILRYSSIATRERCKKSEEWWGWAGLSSWSDKKGNEYQWARILTSKRGMRKSDLNEPFENVKTFCEADLWWAKGVVTRYLPKSLPLLQSPLLLLYLPFSLTLLFPLLFPLHSLPFPSTRFLIWLSVLSNPFSFLRPFSFICFHSFSLRSPLFMFIHPHRLGSCSFP